MRRHAPQDPRPHPAPEGDGASAGAFDAIYEAHAASVERWVRRLGGPGADVEDLMHDVFVVALKRRAQLRDDGARAWLFRITHHVILTRRRRERVRRFLFARYPTDAATAHPPPPGTPADELERRQGEARLYAALDRLPDQYRTALILYELEGLSGEEVAALCGAGIGAIWVRLHRGRARLLALLQKDAPSKKGGLR